MTLKNSAILLAVIVIGVAGGLTLKEKLLKAKMPKMAKTTTTS